MDGKSQQRRERWQQRTDAAYERMFGGKSEAELVTLAQREDLAVAIGHEMAAFLLEEQVAGDSATRPATACCPKCGREGKPAVEKQQELEARGVTTRAGEIQVARQRWRCSKCRVIFFSARR